MKCDVIYVVALHPDDCLDLVTADFSAAWERLIAWGDDARLEAWIAGRCARQAAKARGKGAGWWWSQVEE